MQYHLKTERSYLAYYDVSSDSLLDECALQAIPLLEYKPPLIMYGKQVHQQRNVAFFSDKSEGYYFAGKLTQSVPMTESLNKLLVYINDLCQSDFNGILVNEYCDGTQYIGAHSDNTDNIDNVGVVCCSYGTQRKFRIRDKHTRSILLDVPTTSSQVWIMGGDFQKDFTHEIPVEKKIKTGRVSFTFRKHTK